MGELNQQSGVNQIVNNIKEEMLKPYPNSTRIITHLHDLRTREEYQSLFNSEFYDIVGETFKLNPEYFMKSIYGNGRFYKKINKSEMEKYILEKLCLYDGEQILFEGVGEIEQKSVDVGVWVGGRIYVTNYRIIAHGALKSHGRGPTLLDLVSLPLTGGAGKSTIINGSTNQELPCYGYQFKIKNHQGLKKKDYRIKYNVIEGNIGLKKGIRYSKLLRNITITLPYTEKEQIKFLYGILCKDANQILVFIKEELQKENPVRFILVPFLKSLSLRVSEEYQQIIDSDYLDIVRETYKLNPEFFMTFIYPKMKFWKSSSFLRVKKELFEILSKEGANIQ
ncbi:MAG: hypothetical protein KGD74_06200 [Candidatus Lokiarchaeota archaeon]|nr:hypothetical protein [Candidatus Lokiarchaeota archaeon]